MDGTGKVHTFVIIKFNIKLKYQKIPLFLFRHILLVRTADEFYCAMGQLSAEMMSYTKQDSDKLIKVS